MAITFPMFLSWAKPPIFLGIVSLSGDRMYVSTVDINPRVTHVWLLRRDARARISDIDRRDSSSPFHLFSIFFFSSFSLSTFLWTEQPSLMTSNVFLIDEKRSTGPLGLHYSCFCRPLPVWQTDCSLSLSLSPLLGMVRINDVILVDELPFLSPVVGAAAGAHRWRDADSAKCGPATNSGNTQCEGVCRLVMCTVD